MLVLIKKWKKNLEDKGSGGAVLMESLNLHLLSAKLSAYGFEHDALKLIYNYLTNR